MTVTTDNYGVGTSGTTSQKFTLTAPNNGTFRVGRGTLGAETSFPIVVNADDSVSGNMGVGAGQTWQNVTASRALTTTYTNSTGKAICVDITISSNASGQLAFSNTVAGVTMGASNMPVSAAGFKSKIFFIVPAGASYSATDLGSSTSATLNNWSELR